MVMAAPGTAGSKYTLGVDLGGTKTEIIALDDTGNECFRKRVATVKGSYADTIKTISSLVRDAQSHLNQVCPFGIAIPGTVSQKTHVIKNANSYWLNGHDLKGDLQQELGQEAIFLENDANCFALSEATDGAGSSGSLVWGIILGTGSGSGVVHNRQVLRGRNLLTGEWGHNCLSWMSDEERQLWDDVECFCGRKYCVETFVSGTGLERQYAKTTGTFRPEQKVYQDDSRHIVELMRQGDAAARHCFELYTDRLARSLATYVNFLDPDIIVLGGGMSNVDELYSALPSAVRSYVFGGEFDTPIIKARYGDSSGVRGAAWLPAMHAASSC